MTGFVDDVRPYMEQAAVFAAPLRFGAGIQNKLLEAMAMEVPVITSQLAADGLVQGRNVHPPVRVAQSTEDYAQAIIRELRGEKIDIVEWSEDPVQLVTNALSPAKVQRVSIVDERDRIMEVVVEDKQLSLAIGKKGQNVRLAAKLTGWRIDIKSEEEKRREVEAEFGALGGETTSAEESASDAVASDQEPAATSETVVESEETKASE